MAIAVTTIGASSQQNSLNVPVVVPAGGVPAGALIYVAVQDMGTTVGGSISDSASNVYTLINSISINNNTANGTLRTYYAKNVAALISGNAIQVTRGTSSGNCAITAMYATGIDTVAPLDASVSATAFGNFTTTPSVTSGTPTLAGDLFLGAYGTNNSSPTITGDTGHGWTTPPPTSLSIFANGYLYGANQVNASATSKIFSPTTGVSVAYAASICAFKDAVAASPKRPFPNLPMMGF